MQFGFIFVAGDRFDIDWSAILNICNMADLDWFLRV